MSNVNKVKLLSERTSGVPPVIFNGGHMLSDTVIKCDKQYSYVVFSRHLERKNLTQNIEDFPDRNWRLWPSRQFADTATKAIDCLLSYSISCLDFTKLGTCLCQKCPTLGIKKGIFMLRQAGTTCTKNLSAFEDH